MCEFITATLSGEADVPRARALFEARGRSLVGLDDSPVAAVLGADTLYFATHSGAACDCGTAVGAAHRWAPGSDDAALQRLRRKGWSEAKLQRWRQQREAVRAREERVAAGGLEELTRWHALLGDVLGAHSGGSVAGGSVAGGRVAERVGLLWHSYHGRLSDEAFIPTRTLSTWGGVEPVTLASLEPDRLYEFAL